MVSAGTKRSEIANIAPFCRVVQLTAIRPTVWNIGESHSRTESGPVSVRAAKLNDCQKALMRVMIAPLGLPVVPEV